MFRYLIIAIGLLISVNATAAVERGCYTTTTTARAAINAYRALFPGRTVYDSGTQVAHPQCGNSVALQFIINEPSGTIQYFYGFTSTGVCPTGYEPDSTGLCLAVCVAPQVRSPTTGQCITPPTCTRGQVYNVTAGICSCPSGFFLPADGASSCRSFNPPTCTGGQVLNSNWTACISPVPVTCTPPQYRDPISNTCIACGAGRAWSVTDSYCAADGDEDGTPDSEDDFPDDPTEDADADEDGTGDNSDTAPEDPSEGGDTDRDGTPDATDVFPNDPDESADSDNDGAGDNSDPFPNDPAQGGDADQDGTPDDEDPAPYDSTEGGSTDLSKLNEVLDNTEQILLNQTNLEQELGNVNGSGAAFQGPTLEAPTNAESAQTYFTALQQVPIVSALDGLGDTFADGPLGCPFDTQFFILGAAFTFRPMCDLYDSVKPLLEIVALACWGIVAIRVLMSA